MAGLGSEGCPQKSWPYFFASLPLGMIIALVLIHVLCLLGSVPFAERKTMKKLLLALLLLLFVGTPGVSPSAHADPPLAIGHLLWTNADGTISVWNLSDPNPAATCKVYGPYPGWTAKVITEGVDGSAHLLWTNVSGQIALWNLADPNPAASCQVYGGYSGWSAVSMSSVPSLNQVSGGLLSNYDGFHVFVKNDLIVKGSVICVQGNGGGVGNNSGQGRAIADGGAANNLIINYANDFGRVSVQSELDVHGALGLEPGDIYANNDINIHRNTTVHGIFGVDGAVNLGDGNINSANDININKNATVHGTMTANTMQITGGSDLAEPYQIAASAEVQPLPGMVVAIDPDQTGQMRVSTRAYDHAVGGIISGAGGVHPGVVLRQAGTVADGTQPIDCTGRVWCWCDASAGGAITPGDLLTTSDTPGHAMRVRDYAKARGAIIGKAMSPLKTGKGLVLVLVTLE